jgi:hypothetical protein
MDPTQIPAQRIVISFEVSILVLVPAPWLIRLGGVLVWQVSLLLPLPMMLQTRGEGKEFGPLC